MRWNGLEYLKVLQWRMAFEVADVNRAGFIQAAPAIRESLEAT
jgi:hypothetical protein